MCGVLHAGFRIKNAESSAERQGVSAGRIQGIKGRKGQTPSYFCGAEFADKQPLHSRLLFSLDGYSRQDFCATCWPQRASAPATELAATEVSDWTHPFHAPPPKAPELVQRESAEALLRQLIETDDPAQAAPLFVLAIMLERRRIFVERQVALQPDGRRLRLYEHRKTGETFLIPDPSLRLANLEPVQLQVLSLLQGTP